MAHEFDGKKYAKASAHQKEWGNKLISELDFFGNEQILDLGCGDGALTSNLAALVPTGKVIGIDASQGMIESAKEHEAENLEFLLMDINEIEFNMKFDLVFSNATLHWIKNHKKLWDSVEEILKPGGVVRFNFAADGNCSNFFTVIKEVLALGEYREYFSDYIWPWYMPPLSEYESILETRPFQDISIEGENADRYFPNKEAMIAWIDQPSIVPFLKYIPDDKKEIFRAEVIKRMVSRTLQENGECFETFRRINVFARMSSA
jgi:trans-aconitate methyltransferase